MDRIEYIKASFDNIQELIRFTDQKIGSVLVVYGIEITIFYELSKVATFSLGNVSLIAVFAMIFGALFVISMLVILYISILGILRPRSARHYNNDQYSTHYFEHIALSSKEMLTKHIGKLTDKVQIQELSEQLFEVARILHEKNSRCSRVMVLLFCNIIFLVAYAYSIAR